MRHYTSCTLLAAVSLLLVSLSCTRTEEGGPRTEPAVHGRTINENSYNKGMVRIKVSEELASRLEEGTGTKALDVALSSIGAVSCSRTFPHGGEFEARRRSAGLHRWYDIRFDESMSLTRAGGSLSEVEGVDIVEYCPHMVLIGSGEPVYMETGRQHQDPAAVPAVFNDPGLEQQWHYYNDGSQKNSSAGADINVFPVWENYTAGSESVIVAVVDGGIDCSHEDLAANLWSRTFGGREIHGRNFVRGTYDILPHSHGTHVAGTIGAVNNNGLGVCGVAGGNSEAGVPGVRLMSCQIFETGEDGNDVSSSSAGANALVWAADNGAVIAQNSWGYSFETEDEALAFETPQSDKDAMDYFTANAGFDANGAQSGPMAGGLVIFSAGNDSWPVGYPGDYEACLAVSAIGADYYPAYYTNYGEWVDIAAPGGDAHKGPQVYSTLPGNQYGLMQGTSMACPHVSGVAALLVSYYGGPGFTNTQLRQMLEESTTPLTTTTLNMGKGLVNAAAAFENFSSEPPLAVEEIETKAVANRIDLTFPIPADPDNGRPSFFNIYSSTSPFTAMDIARTDSVRVTPVRTAEAGDMFTCSLTGLEFSTGYWLAVVACDFAGNRSPLSEVVQATTAENNPPVITPGEDIALNLKLFQDTTLVFMVSEPDGHDMTVVLAEAPGATATVSGGQAHVRLRASDAGEGSFSTVLTATDQYGLSSQVNISYMVLGNRAPEHLMDVEDMVFNTIGGNGVSIPFTEMFSDPDGDVLAYTVDNTATGVVRAADRDGALSIIPLGFGTADITVKATDPNGLSDSLSFSVLVRDASRPADFYPNPVTDTLYVRTGEAVTSAVLTVYGQNGGTVLTSEIGTVGPFSPAAVDMTALPGGLYSVTLTYTAPDGAERSVTTDIAKL